MQAPLPTAQAPVLGQPVRGGEPAGPAGGAQEHVSVPIGVGPMHGASLADAPTQISKPAGSRVHVEKSAVKLEITIPPKGTRPSACCGFGSLLLGLGGILVPMFYLFSLMSDVHAGVLAVVVIVCILGCLFSAAMVISMAWRMIEKARWKETLTIDRQKFVMNCRLDLAQGGFLDVVTSCMCGGCRSANEMLVEGPSRSLLGARVVTIEVTQEGVACHTVIQLVTAAGNAVHRFGMALMDMRLWRQEQEWLVYEINTFIEEVTGRKVDFAAMPPVMAPSVSQPVY